MAQQSVGTTAEKLDADLGETPVFQNLGPGVLYIDTDPDVTTGTGMQVPVNSGYEWPKDLTKPVYGVATAQTDVRIVVVG